MSVGDDVKVVVDGMVGLIVGRFVDVGVIVEDGKGMSVSKLVGDAVSRGGKVTTRVGVRVGLSVKRDASKLRRG